MRHAQVLLIPPAVLGIGLLLPHLASAYDSPNVTKKSKNSDWFYNYDFTTKSLSQSNVDVAMTMLWDCDAEIDAIKEGTCFNASEGFVSDSIKAAELPKGDSVASSVARRS